MDDEESMAKPSKLQQGAIVFQVLFVALAVLLFPSSACAAGLPVSLGVNIDDAPDQLAPMQDYASAAGANPAIVMWYQAWSEPLYYSNQIANLSTIGATPMITWDPAINGVGIPLAQIAAGAYDSIIQSAATLAVAYGKPMYIRLGHEMNLGESLWGPGQNDNTSADFIAAWRHVVTIFRQAGATNVQWVWSPNVYCGGSCPFTAFYPGDAWVDWVALDGYNYASYGNVPWMTFDQIFGPSLVILQALTNKPVMIAETASVEVGGSKANWITQTFLQTIPTEHPQIRAVIWFDRAGIPDFRVNSSPASLTAWQQVVNSPLYQGTPTTPNTLAPFNTNINTPTPPGGTGSSGGTASSAGSSGSSGSGGIGGSSGSAGSGGSSGSSGSGGSGGSGGTLPPPGGRPGSVTPTVPIVTRGQIRALLVKELTLSGKQTKLTALRKRGATTLSFDAPTAGKAIIAWYQLPTRAHATARQPEAVPIAAAHTSITAAGKAKLTLRLTSTGRKLLKRASHLRLIAEATFIPTNSIPIVATEQFTLAR